MQSTNLNTENIYVSSFGYHKLILFLLFYSVLLSDPNFLEEQVCTSFSEESDTAGGLLVIGVNQYKEVCVMNLTGAAIQGTNLLNKALSGAGDKCKEIVDMVKKAIVHDDTLRLVSE